MPSSTDHRLSRELLSGGVAGWPVGVAFASRHAGRFGMFCAAFLVCCLIVFSSTCSASAAGDAPLRNIISGDRLSVRIEEDADLSRIYPVLGDGTIELGFVGRIAVANRSIPQATAAIQRRLEETYFRKANVSLEISDFVQGDIMVMGAVAGGARQIPFDSRQMMTLTDALLSLGWLTRRANARDVRIVRWSGTGGMQREVISVDVQHIMDSLDFTNDHYLQARDMIVVPDLGESSDEPALEYLVLGEVVQIGFHPWREGLDLIRAITSVGGFTREARPEATRILRPDGGGGTSVIPVDMNLLFGGDMMENRQIFPGDILFVPSAATAKAGLVYLLGEVNNPGVHELPSNRSMSLAHLILTRGGAKEFSNLRRVRVLRTAPDETKQTLVFDVKEILDSGAFEQDLPLQDRDVITVPSRTFGL